MIKDNYEIKEFNPFKVSNETFEEITKKVLIPS
jgi:hypothetical protein